MAGTTTRGYPYQELGDAPDGPQLGQQLAEAIDSDVQGIADELAPVGAVTLMKRNAAYSIATSSIAAIPWDVEERDDYGLGSPGSNALTVPAALDGKVVMVVVQTQWDGADGGAWRVAGISLNGVQVAIAGHPPVVNNEGGSGNVSWIGVVSSGDVIRGLAGHNDGAGGSVSSSGAAGTYIRVVVVG